MTSWAQKAKAHGPQPTPEQRLQALTGFYKNLSPRVIMREALGYYHPMLAETPAIARPLVEHIIVICVDTESHTMNTDQMTEIGLNHISRKTAKAVGSPGMYGQRLQEALQFLHFRVVEHAHLLSNRKDSKGPLGNRFGKTRFSTFRELRVILGHLFNQEIQTENPELKGCKCPVIFVGHALRHDLENTSKPGLQYNILDNSTVVAKVDTQSLAREVGVWVPPPGMLTNEIGLRVMIEKLGFQHLDDHTAGNDAARTMMCAIHMILPDKFLDSEDLSMQTVADQVEARSQDSSPAPYGTTECCIRCGLRNHSVDSCTADVSCAACYRFDDGPGRPENVNSHIETYCLHVAKFKAWARRYKDAAAKNAANRRPFSAEVLQGPGSDAHPWSNWKGAWPMTELNDVLVGMNLAQTLPVAKEPAAFVYDMEAALGGLPVPSTGNWVMVTPPTPPHTFVATNGSSDSVSGDPASPTASLLYSATTSGITRKSAVALREITMSDQRGRGQRVRRGGPSGRRGGRGGRDGCGESSAGSGSAAPGAAAWNPADAWTG